MWKTKRCEMKKKIAIIGSLFLSVSGVIVFIYLLVVRSNPFVVLTNSSCKKAKGFGLSDSVFGSFSFLKPNTKYKLQVMRSDGKEITCSGYISDIRGIIPTCALWFGIGFNYDESGVGKLDPDFLNYKYNCLIKREESIIHTIDIRIIPMDEIGPIIYSSDESGNLKNAFSGKDEDVYLKGMNFKYEDKRILYIYIVKDRYSWKNGDGFHCYLLKKYVKLAKDQKEFIELIWPKDQLKGGCYDIIVSNNTREKFFDSSDLIDSNYEVGFTIFVPGSSQEKEIIMELACQEPPRDPETGTVVEPPNPVYKDYFTPKEEVWVAINPINPGINRGYKNVRLYVVEHKDEWEDNTPLKDEDDVSGGYEEVILQPGCANVIYTRAWSCRIPRKEQESEKDAYYDVVLDFPPLGIYNKDGDILDWRKKNGGFYVPAKWVCLKSVYFNHTPDCHICDAINIRKNWLEEVTIPEWQKGERSYPAAYIMDMAITLKANFYAAECVKNVKIFAKDKNSHFTTKSVPVWFASGESYLYTFGILKRTPDKVRSFSLELQWYCERINRSKTQKKHIATSINKIFIVLDEPPCPWARTGQLEPWSDVLNYSCCWAAGENTSKDAAEKITRSLYSEIGGKYQSDPQYTSISSETFNLEYFLNNIPYIKGVNCWDMGESLVTFSNSVGCELLYRYSDPFGKLNPVIPIGPPCLNPPVFFDNHAFGSIRDKIFDACIKLPQNYKDPWLTDIQWAKYKEEVVKDGRAAFPAIRTFAIGWSSLDKFEGENFKRQLRCVKDKYDFCNWNSEARRVIPGVNVSSEIQLQLSMMRKVKKEEDGGRYSIEKIGKNIHTVIRESWESNDSYFDVTMVVCPSFGAARKYLIYRYAALPYEPPDRELLKDIGNICLGIREEKYFSSIDFIRHNVIFIMQAKGDIVKELKSIARKLDELLINQETVKKYSRLKQIPRIDSFYCKKEKIKPGESVPLRLKIKNPQKRELHYFWCMSGGGIKKDFRENFVYYGSELGIQKITVTVLNDIGLYDSRSLKVEVLPGCD